MNEVFEKLSPKLARPAIALSFLLSATLMSCDDKTKDIPVEQQEKPHGTHIVYKSKDGDTLSIKKYEHGILLVECTHVNDAPEGPYKVWHDNGQLWVDLIYVDGKLKGPYKEWYDNGQLAREGTYANGGFEGPYKEWYDSGQLSVDAIYRNGKPHGKVVYYEKTSDGLPMVQDIKYYISGNEVDAAEYKDAQKYDKTLSGIDASDDVKTAKPSDIALYLDYI
ncbi:MAG: hypothetical protein KDJ35_09295 [Alphaproteobacteria bacterium]|nr:hypothetical protein [Alphaproteobacteria bacterium]